MASIRRSMFRCVVLVVEVVGDLLAFRPNLLASNGQVVATSETYTRKTSALNTIASIQKNAGSAAVDDQTA